MKLAEAIMERTGADFEDIMNVLEVMEHFLSGFKGTKREAIRYLRKMKGSMFVEISEADWLEWLSKDRKRWKYVERALKMAEPRSKYSLINLSYYLYISEIYDMILRRIARLKRF